MEQAIGQANLLIIYSDYFLFGLMVCLLKMRNLNLVKMKSYSINNRIASQINQRIWKSKNLTLVSTNL